MGYTSINKKYFIKRVKSIRHQLTIDNIESILIFNDEFRPSYSLYISDYRPVENIEFSPQAVYISHKDIILFLGDINKEGAKTISWISDIRSINTIYDFFSKMKKDTKIGLSGIERIPFFYKKTVEKIGKNINFVNYDFLLDRLRLIKNNDEIANIKEASLVADNTIKYIFNNFKTTCSTELDVATEAEFFIRNSGLDIGYDTIVSTGKNTINKTHRPKNQVIKEGSILLINIVPRFNGYCSFFTITKAINNDYANKICSMAVKVILYMVDNLKVGDRCSNIYKLYYKKTKEYGLLNNFLPQNKNKIL